MFFIRRAGVIALLIIVGCLLSVQNALLANAQGISGQEQELQEVEGNAVTSTDKSQSSAEDREQREPELRVEQITLEPDIPVTGDEMTAKAHIAKPYDEKGQVLFRWKLNGDVIRESYDGALNHEVRFGAFVEVEAIPEVYGRKGAPARAFLTVANAPPLLSIENQRINEQSIYEGQIKTDDPEGDSVVMELKKAPNGMTLDKSNGMLRWPVAKDAKGVFDVMVSARDANGGETQLRFPITINRVPQ